MSLDFDVVHGEVHLSNGLRIRPALSRTQLWRVCATQNISLRPYTISAAPFKWFSAEGGRVEEEPLGVELRFWGEFLVNADLHLDVRTPKRHDALLRSHLGEPHKNDGTHIHYCYPWGTVSSLQDGHAFIRVEYAGRLKEAARKFQRINVPEQLLAVEHFRQHRFG